MENKSYQFKTNINCGGCVATVTPHLDQVAGKGNWNVDTANKDKILTVSTDAAGEDQIIETIKKTGFRIEPLNT